MDKRWFVAEGWSQSQQYQIQRFFSRSNRDIRNQAYKIKYVFNQLFRWLAEMSATLFVQAYHPP